MFLSWAVCTQVPCSMNSARLANFLTVCPLGFCVPGRFRGGRGLVPCNVPCPAPHLLHSLQRPRLCVVLFAERGSSSGRGVFSPLHPIVSILLCVPFFVRVVSSCVTWKDLMHHLDNALSVVTTFGEESVSKPTFLMRIIMTV